MPTVRLTSAEWDIVMYCLDAYNSEAVEILKANIDDQLAEQEY